MNQELLQFNKENYIVTNENGKIDFIRTNCGSEKTEQILRKEDELEELQIKLKECNHNINEIQNEIKTTKICLTICTFGIIYLILLLVVVGFILATSAISEVLFGVGGALGVGVMLPFIRAILKNKKQLKETKKNLFLSEESKKELEIKVPSLERELKNLKEQVDYKRFNAEIIENRVVDNYQNSKQTISYKKKVLRKQ